MRSIELSIGGMTCAAACAGRMERKLNRLDGVRASPNYATEKASVEAPAGAAGPSWCGWSSRRRTARPASSGWRIDCAGVPVAAAISALARAGLGGWAGGNATV
jgi:cation transport ATPase